MADIIKSSDKPEAPLMEAFKGLVAGANKKFASDILSPLSITLGDEYQGVVKHRNTAIEIIFYMDEELLRLDPFFQIRHMIAFGEIETEINRKTAYGMLGAGLTKARKSLDTMKKSGRDVVFNGYDTSWQEATNKAFELYRAIYADWPEKDRQLAADFIALEDYKILAKKYDRDGSSMWRKEKTLRIHEFNIARELINLLAKHELTTA